MAHAIRPVPSFPSPPSSLAAPSASGLEPVLEALPIGVLLIDGSFRVRRTNAVARAHLERGEALILVAGTLAAVHAAADARLQRALHQLHGRPAGAGEALRLELEVGSGAGTIGLHLRTFRMAESGWAACVSILESVPERLPTEALPHVEGLSPRRREVLTRLLAGQRPGAIARGLGISEHTVRAYVKDLHRHFGAHSRGELLARFIPAARS